MENITALTKLAEACVAAGSQAEVRDNRLIVDGHDLTYSVTIRSRDKAPLRSGWSRQVHVPVYVYTVRITGTGRRAGLPDASLPQKKDGSFSWDRGAQLLISVARSRGRQKTNEEVRAANAPAVATLIEELGAQLVYDQNSLTPTSHPEKQVLLTFKLSAGVTVERAREIHALLKGAGLVK